MKLEILNEAFKKIVSKNILLDKNHSIALEIADDYGEPTYTFGIKDSFGEYIAVESNNYLPSLVRSVMLSYDKYYE